MPITKELLDACDVIYQIKDSASDSGPWYYLGYVAAAQASESRNIARRSEVGSNATVLLAEESQKQMSVQRLNTARLTAGAPYNRNLPAMIKWIVSGAANTPEYIVIDLDDPAFNKPFDIRKTLYTVVREAAGTGVAIGTITYRRCKLAQLNIGVGAASKYLDDSVTIIWEETINEDILAATPTEEAEDV